MFEIQIEDHCSKLISSLQESFQSSKETNCTLVCEGKTIKCHKYLLVAFSHHFKSLFTTEYLLESSVIIYVTNMKFEHLKVLIDSIYYGKLKIPKDQFPELLKSAQSLGFTHLCNTDSWHFTTMSEKTEKSVKNPNVDGPNKIIDNDKNGSCSQVFPNNSSTRKEAKTPENSAEHSVNVGTMIHSKSNQPCVPCLQSAVSKPLANVAPNQVPTKPAPKAVTPQLFSEANSILSRCLELISRPASNVTQTVPVSTSAPSNAVRPCTQADVSYCQMPVQMNPANSYVNYNVAKGLEPQFPRVFDERIRPVDQMSKMHVHGYMGNKPMVMNYPKTFGKPELADAVSNPAWRYTQQYQHSISNQRPRMFTPINLPQNQKDELNHHLRNFVGHSNHEPLRVTSLKHQAPQTPKHPSEYPQNFSQSFSPFDPKFQYNKCLGNDLRSFPPTTRFENPNSVRRNSMSHSVDNLSQYHSPPREHDATLLSQTLVENRQIQSNAGESYSTKDPFQALIAAKAAIKKKRDDEECSEKSVVLENQSNNSRPCSTNSSSSTSNSISVGRERQSINEIQTKSVCEEKSEGNEKNVYEAQNAKDEDENSTRNQSEDVDNRAPDKLMQVVEECDLFIEEDVNDEDIEGEYYDESDVHELNRKSDDAKKEVVEERLVFQPPIKKRKSNAIDLKIAKCTECGKIVSCIYYLQEHIRIKHKKQNLVCSELGCDFAVLDRSKFNNHLIEVHGKIRKRGRSKEGTKE